MGFENIVVPLLGVFVFLGQAHLRYYNILDHGIITQWFPYMGFENIVGPLLGSFFPGPSPFEVV